MTPTITEMSREDFRSAGLKFSNTANIGDTIRAYDFKPIDNRQDRYIEGTVTRYVERGGVYWYEVELTSACPQERLGKTSYEVGTTHFVPAGSNSDWENRITVQAPVKPLLTPMYTVSIPPCGTATHIEITRVTGTDEVIAYSYDDEGRVVDTQTLIISKEDSHASN